MAEQEYVSLSESLDHLQRHFSGSETVGSKFFPAAQEAVVSQVEAAMMKAFYAAQDAGLPAGRVVLKLEFEKPVGSDALVSFDDCEGKNKIRVIRDAGTPGESTVTAVESSHIPETKAVTVIAGPYGPTGKWGIYTMFPGAEAPPLPNDKQPEEVRQANEKFWNSHGFLATKSEIAAHPRADAVPTAVARAAAPPKQKASL